MTKVHFKYKDERWYVYYSRHSSTYAIPITWGRSLSDCYNRLMSYRPELINIKENLNEQL